MKPATKILLAVLTLFMGVIVVYWGIVYGGGPEEQPVVVNDPAVAGPELPGPPEHPESGESPESAPPDDRDRTRGNLVPVGDLAASRPPAGPAPATPEAVAVLGREEPVMAAMEEIAGPEEGEGAPAQPLTPPGDGRGDAPRAGPADAPTPGEPSRRDRAPASRPAAQAAAPAYTPYVVKAGDTLSSIAQDWFGDAARWGLIQEANPAIDPRGLRIGQVLRLPARSAARDPVTGPADRGGTYTVRRGDTLSSIARILLGEERHWRLLYEANRSVIGPNPDAITVGMRLIIPERP